MEGVAEFGVGGLRGRDDHGVFGVCRLGVLVGVGLERLPDPGWLSARSRCARRGRCGWACRAGRAATSPTSEPVPREPD